MAAAMGVITSKKGRVAAEDTDIADGFFHRQGNATDRDAVHLAVVFVGPCGIGEERLDAVLHFVCARFAGQVADPFAEFISARREVFGDVVEDLRAQVACRFGPAFGGVHRLDGVADVFARAGGDMTEKCAFRAVNRGGVAAIGAGLFAADVELCGAVERVGAVSLPACGVAAVRGLPVTFGLV